MASTWRLVLAGLCALQLLLAKAEARTATRLGVDDGADGSTGRSRRLDSLELDLLTTSDEDAEAMLEAENCDDSLLTSILNSLASDVVMDLTSTLGDLGVDPLDLDLSIVNGVVEILNNSPLAKLRLCMFRRSHEKVAELNAITAGGNEPASFDTNLFSFLAGDEKIPFSGLVGAENVSAVIGELQTTAPAPANLTGSDGARRLSDPSEFSWVGSAVSESVQNQGNCGGCWAFSAAEMISAMAYIQNGGNYSYVLSPQQLVSCDTESNVNAGCNGGNYQYVWGGSYAYSSDNALALLSTYPFTDASSGVTSACQDILASDGVATAVTNRRLADEGGGLLSSSGKYASSTLLRETLLAHPISVAIAVTDCFYAYDSGILMASQCSEAMEAESCELNHAVLLVGYGGMDTETPYFIVKNSWGSRWGEDGFVRIEMIDDDDIAAPPACSGMLGVSMMAAYPASTSYLQTPQVTSAPSVSGGNAPSSATKTWQGANLALLASLVLTVLAMNNF